MAVASVEVLSGRIGPAAVAVHGPASARLPALALACCHLQLVEWLQRLVQWQLLGAWRASLVLGERGLLLPGI